jgi:hypothetical protein
MAFTWSEVTVPAGTFRDVIWVPYLNSWVAVGDAGLVATSPDGVTWTTRTAATADNWRGVCAAASLSLLVAVSNAGKIMTSPDGITWTQRTAPEANAWQCVVWAPGLSKFIAVASSGTNRVMWSSNGTSGWTSASAAAARLWKGVCWSPSLGLLVAVAGNAGSGTDDVMTSPDGTTWTSRTTVSLTHKGALSGSSTIAWSPGIGVFAFPAEVGINTPRMVTSPDGITWTARTVSGTISGKSVVDAPVIGQLIMVRMNNGGDAIVTSSDGITWTTLPNPNTAHTIWDASGWSDSLRQLLSVQESGSNSVFLKGHSTLIVPTLISIDPEIGPVAGGTHVTLTGTNFPVAVTDFAVTFDGMQAANVVRVSDTEITCDTPPHHAGSVDVVVTIDGGDTTLPNGFTYDGNFASDSQLLSARRSPAIRIAHQLNSGSSSMSFTKDGVVDVGATIFATDPFNDERIFTGPILKSSVTFDGDAIASHVSSVSATDKRWFLDKRLPYGKWEALPVETVVAQLLAQFAPDFHAVVEAGLGSITLALTRQKRLSEVFAEIAGITGSHYRLDSELNRVVIGPVAGEDTPDPITDDPDCALLLDEPIKRDTDLSQIRTRVFVFGKNATGSDGYQAPVRPSNLMSDGPHPIDWDILPGAGAITITNGGVFSVFYQLSAITADGEAFEVSGATATSWVFYWDLPTPTTPFAIRFNTIRYHEDARVVKIGLYRTTQTGNQRDFKKVAEVDNDPLKAINGGPGQFVSITDTLAEAALAAAAAAPLVNDTATVVVVREDATAAATLAALEGGDGWHEYAIFDSSIITLEEAIQRGDAELELFKNPLVTVEYCTRDPKSKVGREVTINLTDPPVSGVFKIQQVSIDQIHDSNDLGARYKVTASSQRFTLSDLFHRLVSMGGGGGGGGGVSAATASGGASGWANQANRLTTPRTINGVLFDGTSSIDLGAGPQARGQTPAGAVNGVNTIFTTANTYKTGQLFVFLNGLRQKVGVDYTETTGTTFTMTVAPTTGDVITVDYVYY